MFQNCKAVIDSGYKETLPAPKEETLPAPLKGGDIPEGEKVTPPLRGDGGVFRPLRVPYMRLHPA